MDDMIDRMVVSVRADTSGFKRDVDAMRAELDGPLGTGADKAGRAVETALLRAVRSGKLGFDDLKSTALSAMNAIAAASLRSGIDALFGGSSSSGGAGGLLGAVAGLLAGSPGRATGGPVAPGRAYMVGERGPELFVPTSSGRVAAAGSGATARDVRVAITVQAASGEAPAALQRSSRQVARAVKAALAGMDD